MFDPVKNNQNLPDTEKEILAYWKEDNTFNKSVDKQKNSKKFVFFDGPPFANGLPHYGHILASALKDAVTRYWNMKGYYVPRTNGWDCHGLPVEYEIEKELEISGKKEIEEFGIDKFNDKCRESVFKYTTEWQGLLERIGRWVDFENTYATLDTPYMESIWWVFKQIWDKKLIYQNYRSMQICPRCETPLSNFEVSQGYKEVTDLSVTAKFKLIHPEHPNTYLLAWTTTPWTLPGNMALCMGPKIKYSKVESDGQFYILATNLVEKVFGEQPHKIIEEIKPTTLEKVPYEPLLPYYADEKDKKRFIITLDDYVTTEDGTGIVHIAGGYGAEDFEVSQKYNLDIIVHTGMDGNFLPQVSDFAGKFVKGQDHNIAEKLNEIDRLFKKENYRHSYPHCWRCDTPLLNYSLKSWFVAVTKLKSQLLKNNEKINWQPSHIQAGRFGKWLENIKDWNISRNRYWGTPLPVWECESCDKQTCIGSIKELRLRSQNGNTLYFVRHGQADHNVKGITNSDPHDPSNLTNEGIIQAKHLADKLSKYPITRIFSSPFDRAQQTADIIQTALSVPIENDERIREINQAHGLTFKEVHENIINSGDILNFKHTKDSESVLDVAKRLQSFLDYLGDNFQNEHIVIVTHGAILGSAQVYFEDQEINADWVNNLSQIGHTTVLNYYAGKVPLRENEVDLHKPYIDNIKLNCDDCGQTMHRVTEVLDCWFESGAMPYAKPHYPFEDKSDFEENFPAQFIAEGLDQTRGWFYTLHVLSTILFDQPAAQNIIVNGILLAANGEKLSKRKKNYPDPNLLFETKGVDATRLFMYQSTAPQAEDVRFSEDHVDEVFKKFSLTLWNSYSFFVTYANIDSWEPNKETINKFIPENELDRWILSELQATIATVTTEMDNYNLTKATRPLSEFVDQLSNWYVRRSRRRFWKSENDTDKNAAYTSLYLVLTEFAKLIAPFTPYIAEAIFRNLTKQESVHLCDWPTVNQKYLDNELNEKTNLIRQIVSLGHTIRSQNKIKVRQPLATIEIGVTNEKLVKVINAQKEVILEELNVKDIIVSTDISDKISLKLLPSAKLLGPKYGKDVQKIIDLSRKGEFKSLNDTQIKVGNWLLEAGEFELGYEAAPGLSAASGNGIVVILHTEITPKLKAEGSARDLVRLIQDLRKEADYNVSDRIQLLLLTEDSELNNAITQFSDYIENETLAIELQTKGNLEYDLTKEAKIGQATIKIALKKAEI